MKKIIFMALLMRALFLSAAAADGNGGVFPGLVCKAKKAPPLALDLYWAANLYAPKNCEGGFPLDCSYAFAHGFKLDFGALEARHFNSCPKTGGADFLGVDSFGDYEAIFKKRRYSLSLDLSRVSENFQFKCAAGSLKLYSQKRLAPFAPAASPFVSSLGDSGGLQVSLPTKSSSKQDDAIYFCAALPVVKNFGTERLRLMPLKADFAIVKNSSDPSKAPFFAGVGGGFFYMNYFKLTGGIMLGRHYEEERLFAGIDWIAEVPIFKSSLRDVFSADLAWEIPFLKSRSTFSLAESSKSLGRCSFAQELLFEAGRFSLAAAFFASDYIFEPQKKPWTAANGRESKKVWQAKMTPQLAFNLKNSSRLKVGLGAFLEEQIRDYEKKSERQTLEAKLALGLAAASKRDSLKISATCGNLVFWQEPLQPKEPLPPKIGAAAYYSRSFGGKRGFRLAFYGGASWQPDFGWKKSEWTERLKISFYPKGLFLRSFSAGFAASQKEGRRKFEPSATASFLFRLKCVRLNASVSAAFPFSL